MSFTFLSNAHTFGVGLWFHFSPVEEPGTLKWAFKTDKPVFKNAMRHGHTSCPGYELPPLRILRTLIFCKILNRGCLINNCEGALHLTKLQLYCLYIREVSLHKGSSDGLISWSFPFCVHPWPTPYFTTLLLRRWYAVVYAKKEGKLEFFEHCVSTDLEQCNRHDVSLTRKVAFCVSSSALKSRNVFATDKWNWISFEHVFLASFSIFLALKPIRAS